MACLRTVGFVGAIIGFGYSSYAIGSFFDKHRIGNYFKGILSYALGMITFLLGATMLGNFIDLILKSSNNI